MLNGQPANVIKFLMIYPTLYLFLKMLKKANIYVDIYNVDTNVKASIVLGIEESVNTFGETNAFNLNARIIGAYYYFSYFNSW